MSAIPDMGVALTFPNIDMKKILTLLLAALGLDTACSQNYENVDVKEFAELIADSNVVILDVRKADEFDEGHIKGAVLIDQFQSDFVEQAKAKLPIDKTIAVYCRSGRRSANAASKLAGIGYKCVNLKGGILAWKEAALPVVDPNRLDEGYPGAVRTRSIQPPVDDCQDGS